MDKFAVMHKGKTIMYDTYAEAVAMARFCGMSADAVLVVSVKRRG